MQIVKTGVLASALLATADALTINRAHLRAHRAASRDINMEAREPQDKVVVVHTTVVKYVKSFQRPTKKVQAVAPAPQQPTPAAAAAPVVEVQAQAVSPPVTVKVEAPAPSPAPEPVQEQPVQAAAQAEPKKETTEQPAQVSVPIVSGGKRGLVFEGSKTDFLGALNKGKCSWMYNWATNKPSSAPSDIEFVPMCWNPEKCQNFESAIDTAAASGSKHVLSFNEPDVPEQANMAPGVAAGQMSWAKHAKAKGLKVGSPAITSFDVAVFPTRSVNWLKDFMTQCKGDCHVDFCAVHMYADVANARPKNDDPAKVLEGKVDSTMDYLKTFLESASAACNNKPLWLTEFGVAGTSQEDQAAFMDKAIPFLEANPLVERYSYFMGSPGAWSGLVQDNKITAAGLKYATGF